MHTWVRKLTRHRLNTLGVGLVITKAGNTGGQVQAIRQSEGQRPWGRQDGGKQGTAHII